MPQAHILQPSCQRQYVLYFRATSAHNPVQTRSLHGPIKINKMDSLSPTFRSHALAALPGKADPIATLNQSHKAQTSGEAAAQASNVNALKSSSCDVHSTLAFYNSPPPHEIDLHSTRERLSHVRDDSVTISGAAPEDVTFRNQSRQESSVKPAITRAMGDNEIKEGDQGKSFSRRSRKCSVSMRRRFRCAFFTCCIQRIWFALLRVEQSVLLSHLRVSILFALFPSQCPRDRKADGPQSLGNGAAASLAVSHLKSKSRAS